MPILPAPSGHKVTALLVILLTAGLLLASVPPGGATGSTATTTNSAPVIGSTYFYASDPAAGSGATCKATGRVTSFGPTSGSATTLHVCTEVTDANGFEDVCDSAATSASEVRRFSATDGAGGSISTGSHVKADVALTCAGGSGTAVALLGSVQMEYWRPYGLSAAGNAYRIVPEVVDVAAASAASNPATFDYANLTSLDSTTTGTIDLGGGLAPGATGTETSASIYNKGNVDFSIHVSASDLTGGSRGQSLAAGNLKWAASSGVAYASKTGMAGSAVDSAVVAARETADGTTAYPVYLHLGVPAGGSQWVPADTWTGTVTFATG